MSQRHKAGGSANLGKVLQPRNLRDIGLLAICYFVAGYIGLSLAVPPGYATIIWPASGVALCALLLRGPVIWPGIWLGSFALNVMNGFDRANFDSAVPIIAIAAVVAAAASIQALVGLRLAQRFSDSIELSRLRRMGMAVLLVIALPCLIVPSIGTGMLFAAGAIGPDMVLENWRTWYIGDFFGVLLIIPILLLSHRSPVEVRWHDRSLQGASSLVAISLVTTLLLTFYAWQFISEREYGQAEANFVAIADETDNALRYRLQIYQRALEAGAAFVAVNESVSPAEWREYVAQLDMTRAYPGMRGFGTFEFVSADDLPAFRDNFIREFGDRFEIHPEVMRDEHYVINRIEPLESNLAALGLDLAFEEGRRDAIALSRTSEEPVLTRPIVLVQDAKQGAGFLLMRPVFDRAGEPTGKWVYAPVVAEELVSALTPGQGDQFALEVFHGDEPAADALLFSTTAKNAAARFVVTRTVELAGQPISLRWSSLTPFEQRNSSSAPALVLGSGILITILLGLLLTIFLRRESDVVRKVEEATAELAERNRMLEMAEATAHIGHWHFDLVNEDIRWSDEVFRLHGLAPEEAPPLDRAFEFYHPADRLRVEDTLDQAIASGESCRFKARILTADGQTRHVEVIGRVDTCEGGEASALFGVMIDRTPETLMRERLTETLEEARAADKAKTSFLANMSHEIRTPMNGVIGFTELALSEEKEPAQKRRLQIIADSGNAMLRLLNDLLDFAKIEAKQMAIVSEPTDLRHTLRSCQRLMEPVAQSQDLKLKLDIDPALPPMVLVDKMRFRQIVLNLVGNALKFTMEGEVTIAASVARRASEPGDNIEVTVRDTGIGIAADRLESIFEKFTQADDTTARRFGGTGLGLPISAELAELMGGDLRAESEPGVGSAFILSIPLEASAAQVAQQAAEAPSGDCGHDVTLRVLVAEDNPVNQELTMAMVDKSGHECELAQDGREAVEAVLNAKRNGSPYDLVLMDMQMPEMDGLEATRAIRAAGFDGDTLPIIAVTANAYADDIQRCKAAGMQAHLAKPLRLKDLCAAIAHWSSRVVIEPRSEENAIEEETDPRLRIMFDERKSAALDALAAALGKNEITEDRKKEVASLLHQIAGVAGYFGQAVLGETCREYERKILASRTDRDSRELMETIRGQISTVAAGASAES